MPVVSCWTAFHLLLDDSLSLVLIMKARRQEWQKFWANNKVNEDNNTVTLWWRLPGLEGLILRFLIYWSFRCNPFSFCIHSENAIRALFRNMPFSPREKAPGMTSVINSSQFSTCETTLGVLRLVFGLPSARQTLTYWSKPSRGASRCSEGWCTLCTRRGWEMGLFSLKKGKLGENVLLFSAV